MNFWFHAQVLQICFQGSKTKRSTKETDQAVNIPALFFSRSFITRTAADRLRELVDPTKASRFWINSDRDILIEQCGKASAQKAAVIKKKNCKVSGKGKRKEFAKFDI